MQSLREYRIRSQWEPTGILKGLKEQTAVQCAMALQSQINLNEEAPTGNDAWMRASIPVVRRVFGLLPELKAAVGEWQNTHIKPSSEFLENSKSFDIQKEADATASIAEELAKYIKRKEIETLGNVKIQRGTFWIR
jgi:hypothetical protein